MSIYAKEYTGYAFQLHRENIWALNMQTNNITCLGRSIIEKHYKYCIHCINWALCLERNFILQFLYGNVELLGEQSNH